MTAMANTTTLCYDYCNLRCFHFGLISRYTISSRKYLLEYISLPRDVRISGVTCTWPLPFAKNFNGSYPNWLWKHVPNFKSVALKDLEHLAPQLSDWPVDARTEARSYENGISDNSLCSLATEVHYIINHQVIAISKYSNLCDHDTSMSRTDDFPWQYHALHSISGYELRLMT